MSERKQKKFHYKTAQYVGDAGRDLQSLVVNALEVRDKPIDRFETISSEQGIYRFINKHLNYGILYCGEFFSFSEGVYKTLLEFDGDATELPLHAISPQLEDDLKTEFVESPMYFGVYKNHIILAGTQSMKIQHFERHLNWLIKTHTESLDSFNKVVLADPPPRINNGIRGVQSITFSAPVEFGMNSDIESKEAGRLFSSEIKPKGDIWEAIKLAGKGIGVATPDLNYEGVISNESLEATVEIKKKGGKGQSDIIDGIAKVFRHSEEVPVTVKFQDGSTLTREQFKISQSFPIESSNGIPHEGDIFATMNSWFEELVGNDKIDVD